MMYTMSWKVAKNIGFQVLNTLKMHMKWQVGSSSIALILKALMYIKNTFPSIKSLERMISIRCVIRMHHNILAAF